MKNVDGWKVLRDGKGSLIYTHDEYTVEKTVTTRGETRWQAVCDNERATGFRTAREAREAVDDDLFDNLADDDLDEEFIQSLMDM